jgi:biotin-(acetyl-CoA carboxylase) ligase
MKKDTYFLGKYVKLIKDNDFVLYGTIVDMDDDGLIFVTDQKRSYISFKSIREVVPMEG